MLKFVVVFQGLPKLASPRLAWLSKQFPLNVFAAAVGQRKRLRGIWYYYYKVAGHLMRVSECLHICMCVSLCVCVRVYVCLVITDQIP